MDSLVIIVMHVLLPKVRIQSANCKVSQGSVSMFLKTICIKESKQTDDNPFAEPSSNTNDLYFQKAMMLEIIWVQWFYERTPI